MLSTFARRGLLAVAALTALPLLLPAAEPVPADAVVRHYADMALAKYEDALAGARRLAEAVDALVARPDAGTLAAAREAWIAARVPYMQTEVYRFGNPVVDAWEGRVNAWPLDEGLIDYVDASYGQDSDANAWYTANVIANPHLHVGGRPIDASKITPQLLAKELHEIGGIEANVATGYHAIEFLLWGQDLNGTGPGAGNRPATDFDPANCTGGNCQRRIDYLKAATALLVADLEEMVGNWREDGAARRELLAGGTQAALSAMLTGMGSLSYGELAGERMKLGLILHDPEEEHDCFSDNTHQAHYYDQVGIRNVYLGRYERPDGRVLQGPSLSDLVKARDAALDAEVRARLDGSLAALDRIRQRAAAGESYDQLIAAGNEAGNALVQAAIDALVAQTRSIERVVQALGLGRISIEGSDSLDDPDAVFQ
ncbi:MAG: imelysin family protein [Pseudomonadota bacterium]|jgi:putative iron-regulated protein|nr:MAG: peptidase [Pseudomonadota bacterium]